MLKRIRVSTRALFTATLRVAAGLAILVFAHRSWNRQMGIGPIRSAEDWPRAFAILVGDEPRRAEKVRLYGLGSFIDHKSIWMIEGESPLLDDLISMHATELTSQAHPLADRLIESIPYPWPSPELRSTSWHVTPGYGKRHIEGVELYLILRDETTGRAYVLHELLF